MTFAEWLKRPVYVAQCHTWALAAKLGLCCHQFRCLPGYRNSEAFQARRVVAEAVRRERAHRRGTLAQIASDKTTFLWSFAGPGGVFGGAVEAGDVREALIAVFVDADSEGDRFAEYHAIPPEVIGALPATRQSLFWVAGSWGSVTAVLAPALA